MQSNPPVKTEEYKDSAGTAANPKKKNHYSY
jgi:hypothetical protein